MSYDIYIKKIKTMKFLKKIGIFLGFTKSKIKDVEAKIEEKIEAVESEIKQQSNPVLDKVLEEVSPVVKEEVKKVEEKIE
jgi:uncharacterized protein (DUF2164 family)